jgi:hypothetical protein
MVNASGKPRGKRRVPSPSRQRYDAKNPVLSIRLTADLRDALDDLRSKGDISIADILRAGLGLISPSIEKGYNNGIEYALAELFPMVCYDCEDEVMAFFDHHKRA